MDNFDVIMLDDWCDKHSLRWRLSDQQEPVVLAEGGYLYPYDDFAMGCTFYPSELSAESWQYYITQSIKVGMTVVADGLYESYLSFDPDNEKQSDLAIRICGARQSRMTDGQREHLKKALWRIRKSRAAKELASLQRERDWRLRMLFG
jgi:hypothetical protein